MKIIGIDIDKDGGLILSNNKRIPNISTVKNVYKRLEKYTIDNRIDCLAIENFNNIRSSFKNSNPNLIQIFRLIKNSNILRNNVILVKPNGTSQTCCKCGFRSRKSRLSKTKFICVNCKYKINADLNAAKNIRNKGKRLIRK